MSPINTYTFAVGQSAAGSFPEQRLVIESRVKVVWCNNGTHKSRWKHWKNRLLWKKTKHWLFPVVSGRVGRPSLRRSVLILGSLSNNDGDDYKNVTWKVNSHRFKLYRAYSILFTSSNVGKCFWSWILKDCIKVQEKKRKLLSCVPLLDKTWIQAFSRCSRETTAKKCTKKGWCTCKVVIC